MKNQSNKIDFLNITSTKQLFNKAQEQADKVTDQNYKETIRLYYIVRYFVSLFEALDQKIPIQVWNEYRNAFDHFARHTTATNNIQNDDNDKHLHKMQNHIQRAVLDICKFLCKYYSYYYKDILNNNQNSLSLVTDGSLLTNIQQLYQEAKQIFLEAKQIDSNLGELYDNNNEVTERYCNAVFAYQKTYVLFNENITNINKAKNQYTKIHNKGSLLSKYTQIFIAAVVGVVIGFLFS